MTGRFLMLLMPLVFVGTVCCAAERCPAPSDSMLGAIVRVEGADAEGSGVVVRHNLIATAAHVIEDLDQVDVQINGSRRHAEVVSVYPNHDLALLTADTGRLDPLKLRLSALRLEEPVWAVGYPRGGPKRASEGRYEGMTGDDLQTTASVDHGQSGGALISCENGEHVLAGIITAFGALDMGDYYVRLDDYSVSVPVDYLAVMIPVDSLPRD